MPTPLTPDEEFDAQFRLGLEHYPEQPENPAAWHRMALLLDADLRQQTLRRRVLRLFGAEALLLLLGVWATFSFLQARLPLAASQPPRAQASASRATRVPATAALLNEHPALAAKKAAPRFQPSAATTALAPPRAASRPPKLGIAGAEMPFAAHLGRRQVAGASAAVQRPRSAATSQQIVSEAGFSRLIVPADKQLAAANNAPFYHGKRRLRGPAESPARGLAAAPGRRQQLHAQAPVAFAKAPYKTGYSLTGSRQLATSAREPIAGRGAASAAISSPALPIDLLAPRWPVSTLPFQLPDSLALLAWPLAARPADSLTQPKPQPLGSAYRLRLGLVGAPEFSTVRADRLIRPGSSIGVQLEYQLGRRWRVSAGYLYTNKLYVARGTDYTLPAAYPLPHGYVISNVDAACRIVDIPLNLRYDLWQRPRYQVFASVGLTSLLMRREQYTYDYELLYGKPVPSYSWELANGSQHVLKVLNLSAGYERAVGPRWTVQAEPFVKLPLAGVGFGAVRLSSAGVFFSLKYGLLPAHPAPALR